MSDVCLLGIDLGTTGVRAAAFTPEGTRLAEASVASGYRTPAPGRAEADPEAWWSATCALTRRLADAIRPRRIAAVGVTGQAPTAVLIDGDGEVVRPAILWLDTRADAEAAEIERRIGAAAAWAISRNRLHAYFLGPKLAWLRRHEPQAIARTARVLQSHAYVVFKLTGAMVIDDSTATLCAPLWDPVARAWSDEACAALDVPRRILPERRRAHDVAGVVDAAAARATGLERATPVVVGGGDFASATLGAGVVEQGQAALMLGTAGNLLMPLHDAGLDPRLINSHHVGCDRSLVLGGTLSGAVQEWFRGALGLDVDFDTLDAEAAKAPLGADGLLFLPYLQGERTPLWNPRARGAYLGLGLGHGRGHLYRALLEGVALSFRHCQAVMAEHGVTLDEVVAVNGGARSALWRQILADTLGVRLLHAPACGGTTAGAAILAGLGAGEIASVAATTSWRGDVLAHAPDAGAHERYESLFRLRLQASEGLRDRFDDLHAFTRHASAATDDRFSPPLGEN